MATLDWLTLAEAKAALNLSGVTTYDAEIAPWVTATSLLLDRKVGPVVRRTVTDEILAGAGEFVWTRLYPVTSWTTVTEYSGVTGTALTAETHLVQPAAGYLPERYSTDPALYSGRLYRRASGGGSLFGPTNVVVTYVAGRYADTATVDERFKTAARLTLSHLWMSQRPALAQVGEYEVPTQQFPRWAVPRAAQEILADEWQAGAMVA